MDAGVVSFWLVQALVAACVIMPPAIWPHWLLFVLPGPGVVLVGVAAVLAYANYLRRSTRGAPALSTLDQQRLKSIPLTHPALIEHGLQTVSLGPPNIQQQPSNSRLSEALEDERASQSSLQVIYVAHMRAALQVRDAVDVLTSLYSSDALLDELVCGSFALVSYRQVVSAHDAFTMDVDALESIVSVAEKAGVEALWLDAWCYRSAADVYVHESFCAKLSRVIMRARCVIWLPRSRRDAAPSYQFRLWCTFEASLVAQRGLPVRDALERWLTL